MVSAREPGSRIGFRRAQKLQCGYRYQEVDRSFLEGGRLVDYSIKADTRLKRDCKPLHFLQYEQWMFPNVGSDSPDKCDGISTTHLVSTLAESQLTHRPRAARIGHSLA